MLDRPPSATRLNHPLARFRSHIADVRTSNDLIRLALPILAEQLVLLSVSMIDTYLVGHLGVVPMGAGGLANQFVVFANMLFTAIGVASVAVVARATGARDEGAANRSLGQAILLALLAGVLALLVCQLLAPVLMLAMGASSEIVVAGTQYLRLVSLGFPFASLMLVGNASLRGSGNTVTPMRISLGYSCVNIGVAWVLVCGAGPVPWLGLAGSALGQVAGYALGGLLVIGVLSTGRVQLRLGPRLLLPNVRELKRLVRIAVPAVTEEVLMRLGHLTFIRFVVGLGTTALAAHMLVVSAQSLPYMSGAAFGFASAALVGQSLGAGVPERARRAGNHASLWSAGVMGIFGVLFAVCPEWVIGLFTQDAEVIAAAAGALKVSALMQVPMALLTVFSQSLRGAGDTRWPMLINGLGLWLFRVPAGFVVGVLLGGQLIHMWGVIVFDMTLRGLLSYLRFHNRGWQRVEV